MSSQLNATLASVNPRSRLHALQPLGRGTSEVESLVSYFCRLAGSHSTSTRSLARQLFSELEHEITTEFDWHKRQVAGLADGALTWSAALSAMTTVPGLDMLTFLPWRDVISANGLPIASVGQFCPACLADDLAQGHTPYFRLAWESNAVQVCPRHGQTLRRHCQSCGKQRIRHTSAFVVPGWCTHCGHFLGQKPEHFSHSEALDPVALWRAEQLGKLLVAQSQLDEAPSRERFLLAVTQIVEEMDGGQCVRFARRIGAARNTVHYWLKGTSLPSLEMTLRIAHSSGLELPQLLQGNLCGWEPPHLTQQMALLALALPKQTRATPRQIDWKGVELRLAEFLLLPTPISVFEAARQLDIEVRQLYLRVNRATRTLSQRYREHRNELHRAKVVIAREHLEQACQEVLEDGKAVNLREIAKRVPPEILAPVPDLFGVLRDVRAELGKEAANEAYLTRGA